MQRTTDELPPAATEPKLIEVIGVVQAELEYRVQADESMVTVAGIVMV